MGNKKIYTNGKERPAYEQLLEICLSVDPEQNEENLSALKIDFSRCSEDQHRQIALFRNEIAQVPFSALVLLWGGGMRNDRIFGERYLRMMHDLVGAGLVLLVSNQKKTVVLEDLSLQDPSFVIEEVRCFEDWSVTKREDYVLLYKNFAEWLSKETCGYIPEAKDLDRIRTQRRLLAFESYIDLLDRMDLREQILVKLFYLGGYRPLEEILSLKIEDIDFNRSVLCFDEEVSYPRHLFKNIEAYIVGRKKGFVFTGRDGEKISYTTPFRALKGVVSELKLDPSFTFKDLAKNA